MSTAFIAESEVGDDDHGAFCGQALGRRRWALLESRPGGDGFDYRSTCGGC